MLVWLGDSIVRLLKSQRVTNCYLRLNLDIIPVVYSPVFRDVVLG